MTDGRDPPEPGPGPAAPTAATPELPPSGPAAVSAGEMFPSEPTPADADATLRDAAGLAPRPGTSRADTSRAAHRPGADPDEDAPRKRGRGGLVLAALLLVGALIAALVVLGRANASRYFVRCDPERITAERGRTFPPWGSERLGGAEWAPIQIPPGAECASRETDDRAELEGWYLDALVEQAQAKLTAKEVTAVDQAQRELEQALLLSRAPERRDRRKEIDRLLGDVEYWRGAAHVRAGLDALEEAARRFDAAAEKRPRHASDAAAWAAWIRALAGDLRAGPTGAREPAPAGDASAPPAAPDVPTGVALPVEEPAPEPPPRDGPPDAGVPRGGVLL